MEEAAEGNQIATCTANVTKEDFPDLVAKLWEQFKPQQIKSGFRKAGLCPLS